MSEHHANIHWQRDRAEAFVDSHYRRVHTWSFDGGASVTASASPDVVPVPWSDPAHVDPEEAFVAAISSCHMLWFLALAAQRGLVVDSYTDRAVGVMRKNAEGRLAITDVTLRPHVVFSGEHIPDAAQIDNLHEKSHARCFIANSVKTVIRIETTDSAQK